MRHLRWPLPGFWGSDMPRPATTVEYDFKPRHEGTAFQNVVYSPVSGDGAACVTSLGLFSRIFGPLGIDRVISLAVSLVHPDAPDVIGAYDNGGRTPI